MSLSCSILPSGQDIPRGKGVSPQGLPEVVKRDFNDVGGAAAGLAAAYSAADNLLRADNPGRRSARYELA
jgi:hypothetical protein